jgi:hypothetical protein
VLVLVHEITGFEQCIEAHFKTVPVPPLLCMC